MSFPAVYSLYQTSSSGTPYTATSDTTTTHSPSYGTPAQICSNLPSTAIGNFTASENATRVYILIVEADPTSSYEGINGSYYHPNANWPVITVYQGQEVTIHVLNCPSSYEPHGFAIGYYFAGGVTLSPGQSYNLDFVATTVGRYTVFCNVFCSIHQYMQNGELLVKPSPSG